MKFLMVLSWIFVGVFIVDAQNISGLELLDKSIAYHDADGTWNSQIVDLNLVETRPDGTARNTTISLNQQTGSFELHQLRGENEIWRKVMGEDCQHQLNGSAEIGFDDKKEFRLNCEYTQMIRGYYIYLWGLPMKLKDEGTIIADKVEMVEFQGSKYLSMKVTYQATVGKDIWYFYFNPENYALGGYRFYHDEAANDGEYITLEGEEIIKGIRYPKTRKWYINKDDKFLGSDRLEKSH